MHRQLSFTAAMQFEIHTEALENKFYAELNVTIVSRGLRYVAERSGIPSRIRISEIRMVENVEYFRAELEFEPLLNRKILKDRKIGMQEFGSDQTVEMGIAIVTPPIKGIHRRAATVGVGRNVNRMRPGVAGQYLQTPVHALTEDCGETVIVRDFVVLNGANLSPKLIRAARIHAPGSGLGGVVKVASVQMQRVGAGILQLKTVVLPQFAVNADAPSIHSRRWKVRILSNAAE